MNDSSGFERGVALIAGLITIAQACFAFIASSPRVQVPLSEFASEMILPTRILIVGIIGCVSALSYGILMRQVVRVSIPVGLFVSAILSLIGAWFALLLAKVLIEPGMQGASMGGAAMYTLIGGALLFCGGLAAVGIPVMVDQGGKDSQPTPFFMSTVIPFALFIAVSMQSQ